MGCNWCLLCDRSCITLWSQFMTVSKGHIDVDWKPTHPPFLFANKAVPWGRQILHWYWLTQNGMGPIPAA